MIEEPYANCWFVFFINTWRPRQNGRHFPYDIFKCIFFSENVCILLKISLRFVPSGPINNIPQYSGAKPLSEPVVVGLLTHICVTRPHGVNRCMFLPVTELVEFKHIVGLETELISFTAFSIELYIKSF